MSANNNGGPAFPDSDGQTDYTGGMTLRYYFAAKAMQSQIAANLNLRGEDVAKKAYKYADAMLAQRERGE
jgi:hypothetical protein